VASPILSTSSSPSAFSRLSRRAVIPVMQDIDYHYGEVSLGESEENLNGDDEDLWDWDGSGDVNVEETYDDTADLAEYYDAARTPLPSLLYYPYDDDENDEVDLKEPIYMSSYEDEEMLALMEWEREHGGTLLKGTPSSSYTEEKAYPMDWLYYL